MAAGHAHTGGDDRRGHGVEYPFGLEFKLAYVGGLAVAAALALWGFRTPRKMPGLIAIVAGASLWIMLGLLGLGTGT